MEICTKVLQSPSLTLLVVQGTLSLAAAFLFETGRTWVRQPMSLHVPFTQPWEGQMSVDGNKEMMGRLVTERHGLIPLTSGSDRREVPGIEATGHFSDT